MGGKWNENLPDGITVRGESVVISFQYKNIQCRETLKNVKASAQSVKYAVNLKAEIESVITKQCFKYSEYFPESKTKTARMFGRSRSAYTIANLIDDAAWQDIAPKQTTAYTYKRDSKYCHAALGHHQVNDLSVKHIRDWIKTMPHLKRKTITNRLTPLRIVLAIAVDDELIQSNPADYIKLGRQSRGLITREQRTRSTSIDPFTTDEIADILKAADEFHPIALNYFQTAFYTGCRQSELMGLKWTGDDGISNVDFKNRTLRISQVLVSMGGKQAYEQSPKTATSNRLIELSPKAIEPLKRQQAATRFAKGYVFTRFDQGNYKKAAPLSRNEHYAKPWQLIIAAAGVRYRPAKQCRHSFASQLLSAGLNPAYISQQLGHADAVELFRSYAKWIENKPAQRRSGYGYDEVKT